MLNLLYIYVFIGSEEVLELSFSEIGHHITLEYDELKGSCYIKAKDIVYMEYNMKFEVAMIYLYESLESKKIQGIKIYLKG
jgi:hypothetical protein